MQSDESGNGEPKRVTLEGEVSPYGLLSRDGQMLCSNNYEDSRACVYQVKEEAGKDPVGFMKFELDGIARAISSKGNRVMVKDGDWLKIHDIGKDASKLVCQIDAAGFGHTCALNGNGSEAACVKDNELHIINVDKLVGDKADQSAVVTVKNPVSIRWATQLVYDDGGKLHVLRDACKVLLFEPVIRELILLEAPQEGQSVTDLAISPNADCIAFLQSVGDGESGGNYRTIVKRKLGRADWMDIFGYEGNKEKQAAKL